MPVWLPVVVTLVLGLFGLAVQAAMLAYFVGRMKEGQESQKQLVAVFQSFTEKAIGGMLERLASFDEMALQSKGERVELQTRLAHLEHNTDGLREMPIVVAKLEATFAAHAQHSDDRWAAATVQGEKRWEQATRAMEGVQRQLATMMQKGAGIVDMAKAVRGD